MDKLVYIIWTITLVSKTYLELVHFLDTVYNRLIQLPKFLKDMTCLVYEHMMFKTWYLYLNNCKLSMICEPINPTCSYLKYKLQGIVVIKSMQNMEIQVQIKTKLHVVYNKSTNKM